MDTQKQGWYLQGWTPNRVDYGIMGIRTVHMHKHAVITNAVILGGLFIVYQICAKCKDIVFIMTIFHRFS